MFKTKTFLHIPSQKHQQSTLEFKNFDSILQKKIVTLDKNGKSVPTQLAPPVPMDCGNAYVKHFAKFPEFFVTQCWQP